MFAGTLTSTATLQAALGAATTMNPSVGYATAYPFGVFGPILFFYLTDKWFKPKIEVPPPTRMVTAEIQAGAYQFGGKSVDQIIDKAPKDLDLLMIRREGVNILSEPNFIFKDDDILLISGFPESIGSLKKTNSSEVVRSDRSDFDYIRIFVSKAGFVGKKLKEIAMPKGTSARIIQIRRGDIDLIPRPSLIIEYGDQLGIFVEPKNRSLLNHFFGDSIHAESSFSFVSFGFALVAGALVGLIPIPIPGVGVMKFGLAGGAAEEQTDARHDDPPWLPKRLVEKWVEGAVVGQHHENHDTEIVGIAHLFLDKHTPCYCGRTKKKARLTGLIESH